MATVGITKELRTRTGNIIRKMRDAEIAADLPKYNAKHSIDAANLYHTGCWSKEHLHLLPLIPKDWLAEQTNVGIKLVGYDSDANLHSTSIEFTGVKGYARPSKDYWNKPSSELNIEEVRAMPDETPGRTEALQQWEDSIIAKQMTARWRKVENDVDDFLEKCKSLNEAVKLFPTIRMYIDPEDIERLERKVERLTQRRKIVDDVDTEGLTAAAMAAKLAQAA